MIFFAKSNQSCIEIKDVKKFMEDHYFTEISSVCISLRLLHIGIDSFRLFWDDYVYRKQPHICCILHILLNTLRVYSEYAERMKNMQKFSLSTMPGNFKGTVFRIFCSHRILRIRITAKNEGKLSTSQFVIVHHKKNYRYPAELKSAPVAILLLSY